MSTAASPNEVEPNIHELPNPQLCRVRVLLLHVQWHVHCEQGHAVVDLTDPLHGDDLDDAMVACLDRAEGRQVQGLSRGPNDEINGIIDAFKLKNKKFKDGFMGLNDGQQAIMEALIDGNDVFGAVKTGSGKSLCYQVANVAFSS